MANPLSKRRMPHTPWNPKATTREEQGCGLNAPDEPDPRRPGKLREKFCTCGNNPVGPEDFVRINLPKAYWNATLDHVPESVRTNVAKFLERICEAPKEGAGGYLYGFKGVGKTGIGALIVTEARAWGFTAYCITTSALREAVKERKPFDGEQSIWQRCQSVDFLLLDDLTNSDLDEKFNFSKNDIRNLICNRKDHGYVTIVTSRLSPGELKERDSDFQYDLTKKCLVGLKVEGPDQGEGNNLFK